MDISTADRDPATLLPLTPAVFHLLLALSRGEAHGYALMQAADALSDGRFQLGPGTLYRSIQKMQVEGLIEELAIHDPEQVDERRRYYRMTPFGRRVAEVEADRLAGLVEAARRQGLLRTARRGGGSRGARRQTGA